MTAPTPQRAASAEERDRLREALARDVEDPIHGRDARSIALDTADGLIAGPLAPLLDRITAAEAELAEARADAETVSSLAGKLEADRNRLADEVARLRGALKPFIAHYEPWMDRWDDDAQMSTFARVTFGDLKRLRAALTATGGTTDGQA